MPTLGVFAQITNLSHQDTLIGKLLKFHSIILLRILRLEYVLYKSEFLIVVFSNFVIIYDQQSIDILQKVEMFITVILYISD